MSDKKKETDKTRSRGLWGLNPEQWVTQAELQALSGHGQCAFITTHPVTPAPKEDPDEADETDETVDDETSSESSNDA